jgi:formylglycine-generating enzyme required for sulfatase activity/tRNA A-37 threonylcarbamoyl transferase component Bud32/predicted esterase
MGQSEMLVDHLFSQAVDMLPDDRALYLAAVCKDDPVLRRLVESLLFENDRLSGFLSTPVFAADGLADATTVPPQSFLAPGSRLGRYTIQETLGLGGMGVVYRARDEKLEREVAIKMLASGVLRNDAARRHFHLEALALAKLNHPNIAAVYDVGEQDGQDYIVMELVQGEPLSALLRAKGGKEDASGYGSGPLDVPTASQIVLEVLDALKEAHARGVVHRDLKPGNIMMTPKGHVKVLDFGLAKLLDGDTIVTQTLGIAGTPMYMSPEQVLGEPVDTRTDLWSLGVIYYEALTGQPPFRGESTISVLRAVTQAPLTHAKKIQPLLPPLADAIVTRALEKNPKKRYASAEEMERDVALLAKPPQVEAHPWWQQPRWLLTCFAVILAAVSAGGWALWRHVADERWASEVAPAKIENEMTAWHPLEAMALLEHAQKALPNDAHLEQLEERYTLATSITSEPTGATVEIQDYIKPHSPWKTLGKTPLVNVRIPKELSPVRWKIAKQGVGEMVVAPLAGKKMDFQLAKHLAAPAGMVYVPSQNFRDWVAFLGPIGPWELPAHYMDRYEVTNRDYQQFVDGGGYSKAQYWSALMEKHGQQVAWSEAVVGFTDTTGRPGPSTWTGGHYPEGQANYPVSGVSWYEAMAYAAWAGKSLPVLGQFYQAAPVDAGFISVSQSNLSGTAPAPVGKYQGVGPYGTYDMAGNVREWVVNATDGDLRFALGGSWHSPTYFYSMPEAFASTDRRPGNGFRCVKNLSPLPENAMQPVYRVVRDFTKIKPANDDVFRGYKVMYDYGKTPLNAKDSGVVKETPDWREEKVVIDAAYNGGRFAVYLFVPKRAKPPYQTVLFLPSARVYNMPPDSSNLGDTEFFDYIVQSGRAVAYPVWLGTYERPVNYSMKNTALVTAWYKDAARTLDYLETRKDIDSSRLAYLGVSMGAADGAIVSTLLQDRLKTAVWLDGGYFLWPPEVGNDQVDFVSRMKKPVLMVNGRYDYVFPLNESQTPMFNMLRTPAADKSHVVLDTPHEVTEQRPMLVRTVLAWLDKYLGKV